jgi:hypothetical protein
MSDEGRVSDNWHIEDDPTLLNRRSRLRFNVGRADQQVALSWIAL